MSVAKKRRPLPRLEQARRATSHRRDLVTMFGTFSSSKRKTARCLILANTAVRILLLVIANVIVFIFSGVEYSSRNATKCREHLAFKCTEIEPDVRDQMRSTFSQDYINSVNTAKRSSIWEHFNIIADDMGEGIFVLLYMFSYFFICFTEPDKMIIQCIYCCMNYANKNATKCREHLLDRCEKIPNTIRHRINNAFFDSPLKTWTQVKVPIWKHFTVIFIEGIFLVFN